MTFNHALRASAALAAGLLALGATAAVAAPEDAAFNGPYIGFNLGGAWGTASMHTTATNPLLKPYFANSSITAINSIGSHGFSPAGFTGGLEGGYNFRSGGLVLGIEADVEALDLVQGRNITVVYPCCAPSTFTLRQSTGTSWAFTVRPRIGWAGDNWLIYGTGGLAVADVRVGQSFSDTFGATEHGSASTTKAGWTIGGGAGYAFGAGWSVKAEYLYADFGNVGSSGILTSGGTTASFHSTANASSNIFRVGIDKQF